MICLYETSLVISYDMLVQKSRVTSEVNLLVVKPGQPYFHEQIRQAGIYCGGRMMAL